ncbi:cathepsin L1-like [Anneissia japonica]|uniref:cathepsin L1-like n=1 Tax=Anneissia japonica TaxID=1529436 RepID=UPI001425A6C6|nr:cathepsin L1-like [Anneissia japonica]
MMMRLVVLSLAVVAIVANPVILKLDDEWATWKSTYNKVYEHGEEQVRQLIWEENFRSVAKHNLEYSMGQRSFTLGMNKFADMKNEEFVAILRDLRKSNRTRASSFVSASFIKVPDEIDWRDHGCVTPVETQGMCGSFWAFSATGSLECQTFKKTGKLPILSEQNLIDCSEAQGNHGCQGGTVDQAFEYVMKNGIDSEKCYPYIAVQNKCSFDGSCVAARCTGYVDLPPGNEVALKEAVASVGPISVAIDASRASFKLYTSGIYNEPECSSTSLNHAVLVVGYGTDAESGLDYWLVKNSYGTTWGMQGYMKMLRNKNNQCGIASLASYPLV